MANRMVFKSMATTNNQNSLAMSRCVALTENAQERGCTIADKNIKEGIIGQAVLAAPQDADNHEPKEERLIDDRSGAGLTVMRVDGVKSRGKGDMIADNSPVYYHHDGDVRGLAVEASHEVRDAHTETDSHEDEFNGKPNDHDTKDLLLGPIYRIY